MVTATALNGTVRLIAVRTTELCREAARIHDLSPVSAVIMGRMLTGLLLLASDLKSSRDSLSITIHSQGDLQRLTVVGEADGTVRGEMAATQLPTAVDDRGLLQIGPAVMPGQMTVVRSQQMKDPYSGTIELVSGEIAEDLTKYLAISEQIPSAVLLGSKPDAKQPGHSGGLLVQMMPGYDDEAAAWVEARVQGFPDVTYWLQEGFTPAQLCDLMMGDPDIQYLDVRPVSYHCNCSRERMTAALLALGRDDLYELVDDPDGIELVCHFCNTTYHFPPEQLLDLTE